MEHCPLYEDYKMKIPTLGEVRNSVVYYSKKKQDCIADLSCNYPNCTEKRKKLERSARTLVKSYKSSVVSGRLLWYNGKNCGKEGTFLP